MSQPTASANGTPPIIDQPTPATTGGSLFRGDWNAVTVFYRQLSVLVRAGLPIDHCLRMAGDAAGSIYREWARRWAEGTTRGVDLASQMQAVGQTPFLTALVRAGEATGRLPELCARISDHYDQLIALRRMVIGKLIYPALLIHIALMVPALPGVVLGSKPAYALLAGPGGLWLFVLLAGIALWITRRSGVLARIALLPVISSLTQPFLTCNTCLVLSSATAAGMKVRDSLELAAGACGNRILADQLRAGGKAVDVGTTLNLAAALTQANFPTTTIALIDNGERSGTLEKTLDQAAVANRESFRLRLEWTARVLLGLIYGIAMLLAAYTVVSMYAQVLGTGMDTLKEAEQG